MKWTISSVKKVIDSNKDYQLLSDTYVSYSSKLKVKHKICNTIYEVSFDKWQAGRRCPNCSNNKKLNIERISKTISMEKDYELLSENYINNKQKLLVRHKVCDNVYEVSYNNWQNSGDRCPFCKRSKGEQIIARILKSFNIKFDIERTFDDCIHQSKLRFDFCVYMTDGSLRLIEFNGRQHYQADGYITDDMLIKTKIRDNIKYNYCKEKDIPLLVIPYYKNNIEITKEICMFLNIEEG